MSNIKEIPSGAQFGRWTVIEQQGSRCAVVCACGTESSVANGDLRRGHSSGCRKCQQKGGVRGKRADYAVWQQMRYRCENPNSKDYQRYGALGVYVCERWQSFDNYLADMGPKPKGMSLDRIDPEGPYSPENVRWADAKTQATNKRLRKGDYRVAA